MKCRSFRECLLVDAHRYFPAPPTLWTVVVKTLSESRMLAVILFRISQYLMSKRFWWRLAPLVKRLNEILTGFECHLAAEIGVGLFIAHSQDIVIGEGVRVGKSYI